MNEKFTPGPWFTISASPNCMDVRSGTHMVCTTNMFHGPDIGERGANAHLIAAAPDLYEALTAAELDYEYAIKDCDPADFPELIATLEKIKSALAKARGES